MKNNLPIVMLGVLVLVAIVAVLLVVLGVMIYGK